MFKDKLLVGGVILLTGLGIVCVIKYCGTYHSAYYSAKKMKTIKTETITHGDLSKHFSHREFVCKCCGEGGAHPDLIVKLEELRTALGNKPIKITSGYRCRKHNKEVGGEDESYHLFGMAADIKVEGVSPAEVGRVAKEVGFTFIKVYDTYTHIDIRGK